MGGRQPLCHARNVQISGSFSMSPYFSSVLFPKEHGISLMVLVGIRKTSETPLVRGPSQPSSSPSLPLARLLAYLHFAHDDRLTTRLSRLSERNMSSVVQSESESLYD
jgi:hypothetical protein